MTSISSTLTAITRKALFEGDIAMFYPRYGTPACWAAMTSTTAIAANTMASFERCRRSLSTTP